MKRNWGRVIWSRVSFEFSTPEQRWCHRSFLDLISVTEQNAKACTVFLSLPQLLLLVGPLIVMEGDQQESQR